MLITRLERSAFAIAATLLFAAAAWGQTTTQTPAAESQEAQELAKQLSNPVASLIGVPFQSNWEFGVGPEEDTRFLVNFQPVVPFSLNEKWNLIGRVIVPFLSQPALVPGGEPKFGVSDIVASAFFSPAKPAKFIWGVGPVVLLPATADPFLGTEKWGAGPTAVILKQSGSWTYGALVNHIWSFAGADDRAQVNQTFLQPFLSYGTKGGITFTLNTESTGNWEANSGERWTVPINFQITKVTKIGRRPVSLGAGAGYFVEKPEGGPSWKFRTVVTFIFPR